MPFPTLSSITGEDVQEIKDSLEKQRKELQWLLSSLDELNIKSLSAELITADMIKVGPDTVFEPGYDPVAVGEYAKELAEQLIRDKAYQDGIIFTDINGKIQAVNSEIEGILIQAGLVDGKINTAKEWMGQVAIDEANLVRQNLNLTSPLPTSIVMNSTGITAFSSGSSYARMDYRGLYIQGGAIDIRTNYEPNRGVYFDANGVRAYDNMGRKTFDITSNGDITLGGSAGTFINRDGLVADAIIGNTFVVGRNFTNTKLTLSTSDTGSHKIISNQAAGFEINSSGSMSFTVGGGFPIQLNSFTRVNSDLSVERPGKVILATSVNEDRVVVNGTLKVTNLEITGASTGNVAVFG